MEFETTYEVTPALHTSTLNQYFLLVHRWRILAFVFFVGITVILFIPSVGGEPGAFAFLLLGITLVHSVNWLRVYRAMHEHAENELDFVDDSTVELRVSSTELALKTEKGEDVFGWDKFNDVKETKDFIYLLRGRTPILSFPKAALSEPVLARMRDFNAEQDIDPND